MCAKRFIRTRFHTLMEDVDNATRVDHVIWRIQNAALLKQFTKIWLKDLYFQAKKIRRSSRKKRKLILLKNIVDI